MHKIYWCEGGLQLADISTKNVSEKYLNPRIKYIMMMCSRSPDQEGMPKFWGGVG